MIEYAAPEQQKELVDKALSVGDILLRSILYKDYYDINSNFVRRPFVKSGSETTLLGGELYDKVIIRTIKTQSFLVWKYLYEAQNVWQKAGLDYVPIEPYLYAKPIKNGDLTRVYTTVLDCNYEYWKEISGGLYAQELEDLASIIECTIEDLGIEHGHLHDENFVLRFFRKTDGSIDLSKCPRLYAIDFDRAFLDLNLFRTTKR